MDKFGVQLSLEHVAQANATWTSKTKEFQQGVNRMMRRLLYEAAVNFLSVEDVAKHSGFTTKRVRLMMRVNGMDPKKGKRLLAEHAAKALAENADLLGIEPHEMDLMSPLAYLPMGEKMKQEMEEQRIARVTELPDEEPEPTGQWCSGCGMFENEPYVKTDHEGCCLGCGCPDAAHDDVKVVRL